VRSEMALPLRWRDPGGGGLRDGAAYVRRGQEIAGIDRGVYLRAVVLYALPSLVAGYLAATVDRPGLLERALMLGLPWLTIVLGAAVLMVVVGYHGRGRRIGLAEATAQGLRWVPRYVWTNCHTTVIFWGPVGALLLLRSWQESSFPVGGVLPSAAWWLLIGAVGLYLHCRTLLAPFLAVHADVPATAAVVGAWRLSGRRFGVCFGTFVLGTLPIALPLGVALAALYLAVDPSIWSRVERGAADLAWVGVHAVRPLLVPALYCLYKELWHAEAGRPAAVPGWAGWLRRLTRGLPKPGRWPA
jgi:hypothetical protein